MALSAIAEATSSTESTQQNNPQTNQAIQNNNAPATATPPAATAQPRPLQRVVIPNQTIRNRIQPNPNVVTQPNVPSQAAPVIPPAALRQPLRSGVVDSRFRNDPIFLQNQTMIQRPLTLRERIAARQALRGPDVGLWFGRPIDRGLVISDVAITGPIARFGFLEGDRVVSVGGQPVVNEADFMRDLLTGNPNPVEVVVSRDGRNQSIVVDPTMLYEQNVAPVVEPLEQFGVVLDDRFNDRVVVWRVLPYSPAYYAGFRPGDVITTLSGQPFTDRVTFERAVTGLPAGEATLQVRRGNGMRNLVVEVPTFERTARRVGVGPAAVGDQAKKRAASGVVVPTEEQQKTQPLDPARPNLQGGPREPRANQ
jgi:membrane-associated protease RseP (regulator of RpoE activity)